MAATPSAASPTVRHAALIDSIMSETERYRLALEPTTQDEGWSVAEAAATAGLAPNAAEAFARILIGRPLGVPAMASIQGIALIESKDRKTACMYARLKLALLQARKDIIEYIRPVELTDTSATWIAKRVGDPEPVKYTYTIEQARIAGLLDRGKDSNYAKHPGPMIQWRACGRLCDLAGADILSALATREDLEDELRTARADLQDLAAAAGRGELSQAIASPPQAAKPAARDYAAEAEALKTQLTSAIGAKSKAGMAAFRKAYDVFKTSAPEALSEEIQILYTAEVHRARKAERPESATAAAPAPPDPKAPATVPAPPPSHPSQPPPADARRPYLPPQARGDAYDGPEEPFA